MKKRTVRWAECARTQKTINKVILKHFKLKSFSICLPSSSTKVTIDFFLVFFSDKIQNFCVYCVGRKVRQKSKEKKKIKSQYAMYISCEIRLCAALRSFPTVYSWDRKNQKKLKTLSFCLTCLRASVFPCFSYFV